MMLSEKGKAFLQLHMSVLLAGFTGLFGRLVSLDAAQLSWWRMMLTTLILVVFIGFPRIPLKRAFQLAACGGLLGIHWVLFYASIQYANVSIGVVCYALVGFSFSIRNSLLVSLSILSSRLPVSFASSRLTAATAWASP